jgi:CPA1 family monovalent cation:H+ antiporter
VVSLALVAVRALWIFPTSYLACRLRPETRPPRLLAQSLVLSWAGMRGVVSLAVVLALPPGLPEGGPLPVREALLIVTLTVIVFTLLGQGLTLPWLIRSLGLGSDPELRAEEADARQQMIDAATRRIDELYPVWPGHRPLLDRMRDTYAHRSEHVERQREQTDPGDEDREAIEHREIQRTVIDAEREALLRLRAEGTIDDDVLRALERELDLDERRIDA